MTSEFLGKKKKLLFLTNVDWFFISHRLPIALAALKTGYEVHIATLLTGPIEELESYGLLVHPLSSQRNKFSLFSLAESFIEILRLFLKVKPDVVHLMIDGKIVKSGDMSLVEKVEKDGYSWLEK